MQMAERGLAEAALGVELLVMRFGEMEVNPDLVANGPLLRQQEQLVRAPFQIDRCQPNAGQILAAAAVGLDE